MKRKVIIKSYGEERTGSNERGQWWARDVEVEWTEESANGQFAQAVVINVSGPLDENKLKEAIKNRTIVDCSMYFNTREYQDKKLNNIRGYLPEDFKVKPL